MPQPFNGGGTTWQGFGDNEGQNAADFIIVKRDQLGEYAVRVAAPIPIGLFEGNGVLAIQSQQTQYD